MGQDAEGAGLGGERMLRALNDLFRMEPDDPEAHNQLVREHCANCQAAQAGGWRVARQFATCMAIRCEMRDPEVLREEREFLLAVVTELQDPLTADDEARHAFNRHLENCGVATVGLARDPSGHYGIAFMTSTLRATVHMAAMSYLTRQSGERLFLNVYMPLAELQEIVRRTKGTVRKEQRQLVVQLRDEEGLSWAKIRRRLGPDPPTEDTLKDWYNEAKDLPPRARRRRGAT